MSRLEKDFDLLTANSVEFWHNINAIRHHKVKFNIISVFYSPCPHSFTYQGGTYA